MPFSIQESKLAGQNLDALVVGAGFSGVYALHKGIETFKGACYHAGRWPREEVNLEGKRIGIIGIGATGVQLIQEASQKASHLTVFQRTPMLAIPINQHKIDEKTQAEFKKDLQPIILRRRNQTFGGLHYDINMKSTFDVSAEERELYWEDLWSKGGLHLWLSAFEDTFRDERANNEVYRFWQKKVRARVNDPGLMRKLAPDVPHHPFGVKRPCLEQGYYEVFNQSNTTLIDVNEALIVEITARGIRTRDGAEH